MIVSKLVFLFTQKVMQGCPAVVAESKPVIIPAQTYLKSSNQEDCGFSHAQSDVAFQVLIAFVPRRSITTHKSVAIPDKHELPVLKVRSG